MGGAVTAAGMMRQLERQQPDVWQHLEERHFGVIRPLTQEKQKQVGVFGQRVGKSSFHVQMHSLSAAERGVNVWVFLRRFCQL
jgi:hypothetical protein